MRAAIIALGTSLLATSAPAAVVYTDQAAFDAVTFFRATEDFDDNVFDTSVFSSADPNVALEGAFSVDRNDSDALQSIAGRSGRETFTTFNLAAGISAVSFEFVNFDAGEDVTFNLSNGESFDWTGPANGFFGFVSDSIFTSFTISDLDDDATFAALEMSVATTPIPLPASALLLLGAVGGLGLARRKRSAS